ncbi:MAG: glycosyltransferase [Nitrospirota bacterium]|nr:glycosyltransferase [Nitrospirota bacterium]
MKGVQVHRFRYFYPKSWQGLAYGSGGGIPANLYRYPWLLFQVPFFVFMFLIKTFRVSKKADLLHANWIYVGLIAWIVKVVRGTPFVLTLRGSDVQGTQKGRLALFLSLWVLKRAAVITTVNQDLKQWVIDQGIPEERVVFIRNGVDLSSVQEIRKDTSICRLLFVGSLIPRKGVRYLIESLSTLICIERNFSLTIVGEGAEKKRLKQQVDQSALNDFVSFVGSVPPDQIVNYLSKSDCLVLPSLWEGTPNVVLEAMAAGLPVVASDLSGIREIVTPDLNGLLFQAKNVDELSKALMKIISDQGLCKRMGESGREIIESLGLGWKQTASRYRECYQKICAVSQDASN